MIARLPEPPLALAPPTGALADALRALGVPHEPLAIVRREAPPEAWVERLRERIGALGLRLLHANTTSMSDLAGPACAAAGVPCLGHLREIGKLSRARRLRLEACSELLAVSQATADALIAQGTPPERLRVAYNGIDPAPWRAAQPLRRHDPRPLLLSVGQLVRRKGHDVLLDALWRLQTPVELWLAGERYSAKAEALDLVAEQRETAASLAARGHAVRWLGYREDVPRLFATADLLVHPARQEPLGRVLLEALAAGREVVATDVGGTRELLPDPLADLVPPDDPAALAAAIARALQRSPAEREVRRRALRDRANRFSLEAATEAVIAAQTRWR